MHIQQREPISTNARISGICHVSSRTTFECKFFCISCFLIPKRITPPESFIRARGFARHELAVVAMPYFGRTSSSLSHSAAAGHCSAIRRIGKDGCMLRLRPYLRRSVEPAASAAAPVVPPANNETTAKQPAIEPPPSTLQPLDSRDVAAAPGDAASSPASNVDDVRRTACDRRAGGRATATTDPRPSRPIPDACIGSRPSSGSIASAVDATIADRLPQCRHRHSDRSSENTR